MDRFRLISFSRGGRPQVIADLNDGTIYAMVRDALTFGAPERQQQWSSSPVRFGGQSLARETHNNAVLSTEWYITGGGVPDTALANAQALVLHLDSLRQDRYIEWRPEGATKSTYFSIRGPASWDLKYRWIVWQGIKTLNISGGWQIAPLGEGERHEVWDDFLVDSTADYTITGSGLAWNAGGWLAPSSTGVKDWLHTSRANTYVDNQQRLKITTGTAGLTSSFEHGFFLKWKDASNWLRVQLRGDGRLQVMKNDAGVTSELLGAVPVEAMAASTNYWLSGRIEGNTVAAAVHRDTSATGPGPANPLEPAYVSIAATTLAGGDQPKYGANIVGTAGIHSNPSNTGEKYTDYRVEPCVYYDAGVTVVGDRAMYKKVVGIPLTQDYGALGEATLMSYRNYVANYGFETDLVGWVTTAQTGINAAATSMTRITTSAWEGAAAAAVVTPGSAANEGVNFAFGAGRTFYAANTYKMRVRAKATSGTPSISTRLGVNGDLMFSNAVVLSTTAWTTIEIDWVPSLDRTSAFAAVVTSGTSAANFIIDSVEVFGPEETPLFGMLAWSNRPVITSKYNKAGAATPADPAFGFLESKTGTGAGAAVYSFSTNAGSEGADSTAHNNDSTFINTNATAGYFDMEWLIDPSPVSPDPLSDDLDIEFWGRFWLPTTLVSPTMVLSAYSGELARAEDGGDRYTNEWGRVGMPMTKGANWRFYRLGIITLPTVSAPWRVRAHLSWGAGGSGTLWSDYLLMVHSRRRASSPTAKVNDITYPKFIRGLGPVNKKVRSDLSGVLVTPTADIVTSGLGGTLLEFAPPNNQLDMIFKMSQHAPDDPINSTSKLGAEFTPMPAMALKVAGIPRFPLPRGT